MNRRAGLFIPDEFKNRRPTKEQFATGDYCRITGFKTEEKPRRRPILKSDFPTVPNFKE